MITAGVRIGVLGGIGPEATAEFYSKLIKELQKLGLIRSNKDFPQIIINSIPAPELLYEEIKEEDLEPYVKGLKELERFGVDFIVMICNTIHLYYDGLRKIISVPIIDLRKELWRTLFLHEINAAFVLGTPKTLNGDLYRYEGIAYIKPTARELRMLMNAVFNFNKGVDKEYQVKVVKGVCDRYLRNGVQVVILGCTEFAVMLENEKLPTISTIDVMVDAVVARYKVFRRKIPSLNKSKYF